MDLSGLVSSLMERHPDGFEFVVSVRPVLKVSRKPRRRRKRVGVDVDQRKVVGRERRQGDGPCGEYDVDVSESLLREVGVDGPQLGELSRVYPPWRITQCVEGIRSQGDKIKNKAGYLVKSLKCGYYKGTH